MRGSVQDKRIGAGARGHPQVRSVRLGCRLTQSLMAFLRTSQRNAGRFGHFGIRFYAQLHECRSALAADHEVPRPLLPEGFWNPSSSLVQGRPHPLQRPQRSLVDAFRDHNDDSPSVLIEPFPPFKIMNPLVAVKCMVTSVVLDDQLVLRVTEVKSPAPPAACDAEDEVDLRFR